MAAPSEPDGKPKIEMNVARWLLRPVVCVLSACAWFVMVAPLPAGAIEDNTLNAAPRPLWQTNAPVWALAVTGGKLFAGGGFSSVRPPGSPAGTNETPRSFMAAFDTGTGNLLSFFNHTFDGRVQAPAVSPDG